MDSNTKRQKHVDEQPTDSEDESDVETDEMTQMLIDGIRRGLDVCPNKKKAEMAQKIRKILEKAQKQIEIDFPVEIPIVLVQPRPIPSPSPAAQQVLQNEVILRLLFTHLNSSSLLSNRLVCKMWEYSATRQLLTRRHENVFKIKFTWCTETKKYLHKTRKSLEEDVYKTRKLNSKSLEDFYETCGNNSKSGASAKARQFLCSQTKIIFSGGDLSSTLSYFFQELGVFVRFLSLKPSEKDQTAGFKLTLQSILLELTPNLHSLTFRSSGAYGEVVLDKNSNREQNLDSDSGLEKLKVLKLTYFEKQRDEFIQRIIIAHTDLVHSMRRGLLRGRRSRMNLREIGNPLSTHARKIMEFAPNLQLILDHELMYTAQIVAAGKFHLVKSVDLKFPPDHPNLIVEFAAARPKISSLHLIKKEGKTPTAAEITALNSILQSSHSTLQDFDGVQQLKNITGIQLPVFGLVKKLHLAPTSDADAGLDGRILPSGFDLAQVFPNVVSLQFDHLENRSDIPFNFAGNGNALCGLQHLEIGVQWDFDPSWVEKIASLYPNLNSLYVNIKKSEGFSLFPRICKSIWSCLTQLAKLHFTLDAESSCQGNGVQEEKEVESDEEGEENNEEEDEEPDITDETDSSFTGFPVDVCIILKEENSELTPSDAVSCDTLREFPSILDMKRLTELKLSCVKVHPGKLWSRLTEIHGFERMKRQQNLRVQVTQRI